MSKIIAGKAADTVTNNNNEDDNRQLIIAFPILTSVK